VGITRVGEGEYVVDVGNRRERIYAAGPAHDRWLFWNGHVYRSSRVATAARSRRDRQSAVQVIAAPMPATVIKVLVSAGQTVTKGDTVVVLEAMKMELPLRATGDATVAAVRCAPGDLVQADATLIELS
jgi:biotin carboxyl carrier protein